jgi:CheY-like chemotaxis protein
VPRSVLLAEDEQLLRTVIGEILTGHGYRVIGVSDMFEALEQLGRHREISILVTDVHLGLSQEGVELARRVHGTRPDIGIVLMSGLFLSGHVDGPPGALFLSKPFSPRRLLACVEGLTDARLAH